MYQIEYVGKVNPQQRPRFQVVKTKDGRVFPHTYEDDKSKNFKAILHVLAQKELAESKGQILDGPVTMVVKYYVPVPKSFTKRQLKELSEGRLFPTKKPDVDNVLKAVMDALNGVLYWDDKQVVRVEVKKFYRNSEGLSVSVYGTGDIHEK